jgi:hypothetical protein
LGVFAHPGAVSSDSGGVLHSLKTAVGQKDVVRASSVVTLAPLGVAEVLTAGRVVHFVGELVVSGLLMIIKNSTILSEEEIKIATLCSKVRTQFLQSADYS